MGLSCTVSEIDDFSRKLQNFPTLVFCAPAKGFPFELGTGAWGQKLGVKVDPNKLRINVKNKKMPNLMQILSIFLKLKAVKQSGPGCFAYPVGIAILIGPAEKMSRTSPVLLLIQKLFWASDEVFKIASCIAPQTQYLRAIQIQRVIRWPSICGVLVKALLRDTCNARRTPCILLNLPLRLAAVG